MASPSGRGEVVEQLAAWRMSARRRSTLFSNVRSAPDRLDQLGPLGAPFRIATAHIDGRQRLGDLREGHRPDLTLYKSLPGRACGSSRPTVCRRASSVASITARRRSVSLLLTLVREAPLNQHHR